VIDEVGMLHKIMDNFVDMAIKLKCKLTANQYSDDSAFFEEVNTFFTLGSIDQTLKQLFFSQIKVFQPEEAKETADVACGSNDAEDDDIEIVSSSESAAVVILKQLHKEAMERYNKQSLHFRKLVSPTNRLLPIYMNWVEGADMDLNI